MADSSTLVNLLRAAGEGTRLRLLTLLSDGEHSVKDLTEILGQSQPRVSRHLKLLADAGLVTRNAEGAWAYYGLTANGAGGDLARWLIRRIEPGDPDRQRDLKRLEAVRTAQQAQAAAYFAKVADSWDMLRSLHAPEEAVEAAILEALGDRVVDLLVDLGTGTGRMLELLKDHYQRGIGIDASREMIAVARAKLGTAAIGHAQIRLGDIADLDAGLDGQADVVVIHQVLHYFDDPGKMLAQARRVLKRQGEMLIVDFAPHELEFLRTHHAHRRLGLAEAQMATWATAAGLEVVSVKCFPPTDAEGLTVCLWRLKDKERAS